VLESTEDGPRLPFAWSGVAVHAAGATSLRVTLTATGPDTVRLVGTDPAGTPVVAANDGTVIIAQPMFYEGNLVVIDHGQQFSTLYMHFSRIDVKVGQQVKKGQRLGLSGATGRVTGPHLHFAARWQGAYVDPVLLLKLEMPPN